MISGNKKTQTEGNIQSMITFKVTGTRNVDKAVKKLIVLEDKITGKDPQMYKDIQKIVFDSTAKNFAAQGRPAWKARKHTYVWPILAMTGKLLSQTLNSIKGPWQHSGKTHIKQIFSPFYGAYHQYKSARQNAERKYVLPTDAEKTEIKNVITKAFKGE